MATELIEGDHDNKDNIMLMRADLMRRAGQFDELIAGYVSVKFDEDLINQIVGFPREVKENALWQKEAHH